MPRVEPGTANLVLGGLQQPPEVNYMESFAKADFLFRFFSPVKSAGEIIILTQGSAVHCRRLVDKPRQSGRNGGNSPVLTNCLP